MFPSNKISTAVVGREFDGGLFRFNGIIPAKNGKLYLVPFTANKVVSFDPQTNEWNEIGDNLGDEQWKWDGGTLANDGRIFCNPYNSNDILVINTTEETTTLIALPNELHGSHKYISSSSNQNGNIFFFPLEATKIFKVQTSTNTISILNITCCKKWSRATLASNGHIYVTPAWDSDSDHIMDFDPTKESFSKIKHSNINKDNRCSELVEYGGHLYGISERGTIKIDVATNDVTTTNHQLVQEDWDDKEDCDWNDWSDSFGGRDGCVYALSMHSSIIIRHDPFDETTTVGETQTDSETGYDGGYGYGWVSMCLGSNGNGYCAPYAANQILKIHISKGHWHYLKYRLLIHKRRATTHEQGHEGLETVRQFIISANDDEFSYVMEFI